MSQRSEGASPSSHSIRRHHGIVKMWSSPRWAHDVFEIFQTLFKHSLLLSDLSCELVTWYVPPAQIADRSLAVVACQCVVAKIACLVGASVLWELRHRAISTPWLHHLFLRRKDNGFAMHQSEPNNPAITSMVSIWGPFGTSPPRPLEVDTLVGWASMRISRPSRAYTFLPLRLNSDGAHPSSAETAKRFHIHPL